MGQSRYEEVEEAAKELADAWMDHLKNPKGGREKGGTCERYVMARCRVVGLFYPDYAAMFNGTAVDHPMAEDAYSHLPERGRKKMLRPVPAPGVGIGMKMGREKE